MTKKSKNLPIEILDILFQLLPKNTLLECQKVCQLWYSCANHHLMNHVTFYNQDEVFRFLDFLQLSMTSRVRKMKIRASLDINSKKNFQKLIMCVPKLQELEIHDRLISLHHLNDIVLPTSLKSITISFNILYITKSARELVKLLTKYRGIIQKLNLIINVDHYDVFENWDMMEFFDFFPKLTDLDINFLYNIHCLMKCLPVIQGITLLKSISFYIRYDTNAKFNSEIQYKQKLEAVEMLKFRTPSFLHHTLSFIIHNFVGLKEINAKFNNGIFKNLNDSVILLEFLNFIYLLDTYDVEFSTNHEFYLMCSNVLSNAFTHLPETNQNVSKHLHISACCPNFQGDGIHHYFQLKSKKDYCNRLQRIIKWKFAYEDTYKDELFDCIILPYVSDVDIFRFDIHFTPFVTRCFDFFFDFLSLLIKPKKVILIILSNPELPKYKPSNQLDYITQLEIQVMLRKGRELDGDNIPFSLNIFPNLKTLYLVQWCGIWYSRRNTYSLELPLISLESLHVDVIQLYLKAKDLKSKYFELIVEKNTVTHSYEISIDTLYASKILKTRSRLFQKNCIQFHIKVPNIQYLHLEYNLIDNSEECSNENPLLFSLIDGIRTLILL